MTLEGKIALVTGAGSGIGAASALALAKAGADVIVVSRTAEEIDKVAEDIEALGRTALSVAVDVADEKQMARLFQRIKERFGRLDFVLANAGVNGVWAPIEELKPAEWDETIRINLRGTYLTVHNAVPLMKKAGGSIAITSSINGTRTFTTAGASAYSTTKAGQLALGQMLALELARYRIRVNVICPGAIGTEIGDNTKKRATARAKVPAKFAKGTVPLTGGKAGSAAQVADLVLFLASDSSRHISGTPVWIDGAQSLLV
ncbi:MAG TPA: SDR family NAD(P)-dependent oxidoreductase [Devosia sp.]|jgi:NAD(P)-dependent dehydrogenase (short-subunit alcohol dehydrogenase family)|nr:SDR family NAD(P)-dependent oxidoreductase [Devosia sp.]